jgi:cytochrome P450
MTDYASVAEALRDSDTFSHRYDPEADDGIDYNGVNGLPRMEWPSLAIGEAYGEHHSYLRRVLNPFFSPLSVRKFESKMHQVARWLLDQHVESGSIDLMNDYIVPMTSISTLLYLGLSADLWKDVADAYHSIFGLSPATPEYTHTVTVAMPRLMDALVSATKAAREHPSDGLLSAIAALEFEGEAMDDQHLYGVVSNLIGGGVDTTNNVTAWGLRHLSDDPPLRDRVIADRALIDAACEEALRMYPSGQSGALTVTKDVEIGGEQLRRGDHVVITFSGANRDPEVFPNPDTFDIDRTTNRHLTFGLGPYRCLGLHLARQVFRVMVTEVLDRIPDYVVDQAAMVEYSGNPYIMGVFQMPATFTPVPKEGVPRPW